MSAITRAAYATARPLWHRVERYPRIAQAVHGPVRAAWNRFVPLDPTAGPPQRSGATSSWPFVARERAARTGAVLVIDSQVLQFDRNAGDQYMRQYLAVMQHEGYRLTYFADDRVEREPYAHLLRQAGIETITGDLDMDAWLRINGPFLDAVLLARPQIAQRYLPVVRRHSRARVVYFNHDLHFLRERRRFEATRDPHALRESEKLLLIERQIVRSVDAVATPSSDEVEEIRRLGADRVFIWAPYIESTPGPPMATTRDAVLFVGGFAHLPNVDAAVILAREVMPLVWRELPGVPLLLVGNAPTDEVRGLASGRVTVTGYVPDLAPYYARARATVNPLRFGAGLKGKIVASLAAGVPVVATRIANEGIGLVDGRDALFGETPEELAAQVVRLFRTPELAESVAARGRELVERRFSRSETTRAILAALDSRPIEGPTSQSES